MPPPPAAIEELFKTYKIYGIPYNRIPYGSESNISCEEHVCDHCATERGSLHLLGCGIEQCPACGGFSTSCACAAFDVCMLCEGKTCYCGQEPAKCKTSKELGLV